MDFLTNANDFMPVVLGAFVILAVLALWSQGNIRYWERQAGDYFGRVLYKYSFEYARRRCRAWTMVAYGLLGLLAVVVMYFGYLVMTDVPPALYY